MDFQKAMDRTIINGLNMFCFLNDIIVVSKGTEREHEKVVRTVMKKLDEKCEFFKERLNWSESGQFKNHITLTKKYRRTK